MMRKLFLFLILLLFCSMSLASQDVINQNELNEGLQYYSNGSYQQAVISFRNIILNPQLEKIHGDAYFWLAKSYFILKQYDNAERSLESFLVDYEDHSLYPEALYLKGRILFVQDELESAIQVFQGFIDSNPESELVSNAYFWVGEALYLLGSFDSSLKLFHLLIQQYPQSVKVEAANYRISLMKLKIREDELLKLLKMSHEEYLKTLEECQRKERTYQQAITAYQKKLATSEQQDAGAEINQLRLQLKAKDREIADLKEQIEELNRKLSEQHVSAVKTESVETTTMMDNLKRRERLLLAKEKALDLELQLIQLSKSR